MAGDSGAVGARAAGDRPRDGADPQQLRAEIERVREELGETVAALAYKTDVKARAREKAAEVRGTVMRRREEAAGRARQSTPGGASAAIAQAQALAEQHPVVVAALVAFVGGLLAARLGERRS